MRDMMSSLKAVGKLSSHQKPGVFQIIFDQSNSQSMKWNIETDIFILHVILNSDEWQQCGFTGSVPMEVRGKTPS